MTVEKTSIIQDEANKSQFFFIVSELTEDGERQVQQSRRTILDRPCWRDDLITNLNTQN